MHVHLHEAILLLALIVTCLAQNSSSVVKNKGPIDVEFGQRTIIKKSGLRIKPLSKSGSCFVKLRSDEATSSVRIGRLSPSSFPCNYKEGEVHYDHFGIPIFNSTSLEFLVTYFTEENEFTAESFSVPINIVPAENSVITRNTGIDEDLYNWYSKPISPSSLGLTYDKSTQDCRISLNYEAESWPRYGNVVNDSLTTTNINCDTFLSSKIMYRNTALISPQIDYIEAVVIITDEATGDEVRREWFTIRVNIIQGAENQPPRFSELSLLQLEVNQFITTAITPDILSAEDDFTESSNLIFIIDQNRLKDSPMIGSVISTNDETVPVQSFTLADVKSLKIAYSPPVEDSDVERIDRIPLRVMDGEGQLSLNLYDLVVTIKPKDTKAPIVTKNTGLKLLEGSTSRILSSRHLMLTDEDNLNEVLISVQYGLKHGRLDITGSRSMFTISDLNDGNVRYTHDDSDTLTDNVIFKASDGRNEIEFLFPITVIPVDDSAPVLQVNTGLKLFERMTFQITALLLKATDSDSDDSLVTYTLEQPYSDISEFVLHQKQPEDQRGWRRVQDIWEKRVTSWTQSDINNGYLHYRHTARRTDNTDRDRIKFKLSDSNIPPNISPTHTFMIRITERDNIPPIPSPDASFHLTVQEGKITPITEEVLLFTDDNSKDKSITYTVTAIVPTTGDQDGGRIVYTDQTDVDVPMFTQGEINKGKISYVPITGEIGIVPRMVNVYFDVRDINGNMETDQHFTIFIQPVNDKPPTVTVNPIEVYENGYAIIMPANLAATDPDTAEESLTFTVERLPRNGQLKLQGVVVKQGSKFSNLDISTGGVVYSSDGNGASADTVVIDVSDGMHHIAAHLRIRILPVDTGFPTYESGDAISYQLSVDEGQTAFITTALLPRTGVSDDVMFTVTTAPIRGRISKNTFNLTELEAKAIYYEEGQGEIGAEPLLDSFNLTVTEGQILVNRKLVPQIYVQVTILPVDNNSPVLSAGTTFYVPESGFSVITPSHLSIVDIDSNSEDVLCTLNSQPEYGYLELSSPAYGSEYPRTGQPISAFTLEDLNKGHLNYRQSIHDGIEPMTDSFHLICSDGINTDETGLEFVVSITPTNDETPKIYINDFVVEEGRLLQIDLPILNVIDKDNPPDFLKFKVLKQPINGRLLYSTPNGAADATEFNFDDIRIMSKIAYLHNDTETTNDSVTLEVTDGIHSSIKEIPIKILPVDDEVPQIVVNTGLYIKAEKDAPEWKFITNRELKAEDIDSPNGNITYKIRQQPVFGFLQRRVEQDVWDNITRHMTFQQWELDEAVIRYVHNGRYGVRDVLKLDISDVHKNSQIDNRFYITVEPLDMVYPDVVNRGLELPESQSVILTTDMLSAWDDKSSAESIIFTVTASPKQGILELTDAPGQPISTFSQIDLAAGKVRYKHTGYERSSSDGFEFEVTDGFNPLHRAFTISILPVDNQLPVLMIQPIRLREKGFSYITPNQLMARDRDTSSSHLTYTVVQAPLYGVIKLDGEVVASFTQNDLENGKVTYTHNGPERADGKMMTDSFKVTVTDGVHRQFYVYPDLNSKTTRAQRVPVQIASVDDSIPQLVINNPASYLTRESPSGKLSFSLTSQHLKVTDQDTSSNSIIYWLMDKPILGRLVKDNQETMMWTQDDIDRSKVKYILYDGVKDTTDHFTFRIQDGGGNDIPSTVFTLSWSYISFKQATLEINETDGFANVTLQRRGSLKSTAFVSVRIRDVTTSPGADYSKRFARQVQFNPGEFEATWRLKITDDDIYEVKEMLTLELFDPVGAALEPHEWATLTINDPDDQPLVSLASSDNIRLSENVGRAAIKVKRTGDLSSEVIAVCNFKEGTTKGTDHPALYTDFILRSSAVRFLAGQSEANCFVDIIDDSYIEPAEDFKVFIEKVEGGKIVEPSEATVTILEDDSDLPQIQFQTSNYQVTEGQGTLTVEIKRTGGDLTKGSEVLVISTRHGEQHAEPMIDYIPVSKSVVFNPREMMKTVKVSILDDRSMPMVEGLESFSLQLRFPESAVLGSLNTTVITILDETDIPDFAFAETRYTIGEVNGTLTCTIKRYGDVSASQSIRCITQSETAKEGRDFVGRRSDSSASIVIFNPGDREAFCSVTIINDSQYENEETFKLQIITDKGDKSKANATVTITDEEDKPVLSFMDTHLYVSEPESQEKIVTAKVLIQRSGDLSQVSIVTVYTKEGSAIAGVDYLENSAELEFGPGVKERSFEVTILYDGEQELRESFSVMMSSDSRGVAVTASSRCSVYITDENTLSGLVFPVDPIVISLSSYDLNSKPPAQPINGYPLICVTPCDERHPEYSRTKVICDNEDIDNSLTQYRWKVGQPIGRDGLAFDLQTVTSTTFITSTEMQTLDSIYFSPGSRVQCLATAGSNSVYQGLERESQIVTISMSEGVCKPQRLGFAGGEPYLTKIKYLDADHKKFPNHVKLSISIPHRDGMLPAISTEQLSNFEYMLSPSSTRVGLHRCSNLVSKSDSYLHVGWRESRKADEAYLPYQHDRELRGGDTVKFYSNLDLENCVWEFDGFFKLPELIGACGADVETDGKVKDLTQSYVSVVIPLYVSYVFHSMTAPGGWQHYDLKSNQRITFVYDTGLLLRQGISNIQADQNPTSDLTSRLFLHSMKIKHNGHLVVEFQTQANFYGKFVLEDGRQRSTVTSYDFPKLSFDLELVQGEHSFDNPKQMWQFTSDSAIQDYTGKYIVSLLPCLISSEQSYTKDAKCNIQKPLTFELDLELQQVSDPVSEIFSLNTELTLTRSKRAWLSNNRTGDDLSDVAFRTGEKIYGRVDTRQLQDDQGMYDVLVEKVFVCAGKDGFVPKYQPDTEEYGCAADSGHLQAQFKILDKSAPDVITKDLNGIPFNAQFAAEHNRGRKIYDLPGVDGFVFDSKPLNSVSGRKWFVHVIYSINTLTDPLKMMRRYRRAQSADLSGVGHEKGTNMAFLYLAEQEDSQPDTGTSNQHVLTYTWAISIGVVSLLLILVIAGIMTVMYKMRKLKQSRQNRHQENTDSRQGPESTPMPVDEEEGVVRMDTTVSTSEI